MRGIRKQCGSWEMVLDRMCSTLPPAAETICCNGIQVRILAPSRPGDGAWSIECGYVRPTMLPFPEPEQVFSFGIPSHAVGDAVLALQQAASWLNSQQTRKVPKRLFLFGAE